MLEEDIYTVEEVSQHLKVPVQAVQEEIASGKLRAMKVGRFVRISQHALADYKNAASASAESMFQNASKSQDTWLHLAPAADFGHTWPDGTAEHFQHVQEGTASYAGREYHVRLGFTVRDTTGRRRTRCALFVNRYPAVEFVKAEETDRVEPAASIIK